MLIHGVLCDWGYIGALDCDIHWLYKLNRIVQLTLINLALIDIIIWCIRIVVIC